VQLVDGSDGVAQLVQLLLDGVGLADFLRRLEEGARIDAVRDGYDGLPSS
jgi:hypothetical protein